MEDKKSLALYSITHFIIDFSCYYVLMGNFFTSTTSAKTIAFGFLLYNALIPIIQVPLSHFLGQNNSNYYMLSLLGIFWVSIGVVFPWSIWLQIIFCAIGNSFFELGAGIETLSFSLGKNIRFGIYNSFGALGVAFGTITGMQNVVPSIIIFLLILCSGIGIYFFAKSPTVPLDSPFRKSNPYLKREKFFIITTLLSVLLQSTLITSVSIKNDFSTTFVIIFGLGLFLGKLLSILLTNIFDRKKVAIFSAIIATPFLCFSSLNIFVAFIAVILISISNILLICSFVSHFPKNLGLGFSIINIAYMLGTIFPFMLLFIKKESILSVFITSIAFIATLFLIIEEKKIKS